MRVLAQERHCDLGLIDDDNTEDLRKENAPGRCANTAEGDRTPTQPLSEEKVLMTTLSTNTDPGLPPDAEPDFWVGGQRDVYAQIGYVPVSPDLLKCPAITVVGEQRTTGHLGKILVVLDVALTQSNAELTPAQARELASLLVAGADLADIWAGVPAAGRRDCDLLGGRTCAAWADGRCVGDRLRRPPLPAVVRRSASAWTRRDLRRPKRRRRHRTCRTGFAVSTDNRFGKALDALEVAKGIVDDIYPIGAPSEARGAIASAARELVKAGDVSTCDVDWCDSTEWLHREHTYSDTVTARSGVEHIEIGAAIDPAGDRDDEIVFRAWFAEDQDYDSVVVELSVDQARAVIAAIELAIARRAELRGADR